MKLNQLQDAYNYQEIEITLRGETINKKFAQILRFLVIGAVFEIYKILFEKLFLPYKTKKI